MQLGLRALANVPWTELIRAAPRMMESAVKLYDSVSGRQRQRLPRDTGSADGIPTLRADVTELQERLDTLEGNDEAQADLIAQMTRRGKHVVKLPAGFKLSTTHYRHYRKVSRH